MPAKKAAKKGALKTPIKVPTTKPKFPVQPLYGMPIRDAIKRGNLAEMKALSTQARKHVADVTSALASLDKALSSKR